MRQVIAEGVLAVAFLVGAGAASTLAILTYRAIRFQLTLWSLNRMLNEGRTRSTFLEANARNVKLAKLSEAWINTQQERQGRYK
jgi:hypothetical protein